MSTNKTPFSKPAFDDTLFWKDAENQQKKLILIVDDEPDIRESLELRFRSKGYDTITAANGREALSKTKSRLPDLIILDLYMPEMNGHDTLKAIRSQYETHTIPVIVLTASKTKDDQVKSFDREVDAYMMKPFNSNVLIEKAQKLMFLAK